MIPVPILSAVDVAFPANVRWIPRMEDIPEQFRRPGATKGGRLFSALFAGNVDTSLLGMLPREGVVAPMAWRALQVCLGTFGISHEHKEAAFAFLIDQWFEDIRWSTKDGSPGELFEDRELDAAWLAKCVEVPRE